MPLIASRAAGIRINTRKLMLPPKEGKRPQPSPKVQGEIRRAITAAFDALPADERPEAKAKQGNLDDFGQRAVNLDDSAHCFNGDHSYERCYLHTVPAASPRAVTKTRRHRFDNEVECCEPFIGVELGRHEIHVDGVNYCNWTEREVQPIAHERAKIAGAAQPARAAASFSVRPTRSSAQLLMIYRVRFKSAATRAAYMAR